MSKNNVSTDTSVSKSAAKRNQRRKEIAAKKQRKRTVKTVVILVLCLAVLGIGFYIGQKIYFNANKTVASYDYSKGLNEDGTIAGLDVSKYVKAPDYKSMNFDKADLVYSDEDVDSDIETIINNNPIEATDNTITLASGDKINLDYVGYVDGETFEGGNTKGNGTDLVLGSDTYIDTFEEQIIGHKVGETFDIHVTFPTPYEVNPDMSGKEARFEVTVNCVYRQPEFNDAFVKEHYGDVASTVEEYRDYVKTTKYEANLRSAVIKYIQDNAENSSYPKKYLKALKSIQRADDESQYAYMNSYYAQVLGTSAYASFEEYIGKSDRAYEKDLAARAKVTMAQNMLYQYIYETEGLTCTADDYAKTIDTLGNGIGIYEKSAIEEAFGKGFVAQQTIQNVVVDYLMKNATINNLNMN